MNNTGDDEVMPRIRDYDTCFAEFLKPPCNGQKIMQAILLREAFSRFVQHGIGIKRDAPTTILDVSCGPGDYSVAWTSEIARYFPKGMMFYCTDYPGGVSRATGEQYTTATVRKIDAAAQKGQLPLSQPAVGADADLFSGGDLLMPPDKLLTSFTGHTAGIMCAMPSDPTEKILTRLNPGCRLRSRRCGERSTRADLCSRSTRLRIYRTAAHRRCFRYRGSIVVPWTISPSESRHEANS
jgi:hypothetical protein